MNLRTSNDDPELIHQPRATECFALRTLVELALCEVVMRKLHVGQER